MNDITNKGRRRFIKSAATVASALALAKVAPTWAIPRGRMYKDEIVTNDIIQLDVSRGSLPVAGKLGNPITINGQMPGPLIRLKEGSRARINVTNKLAEDTSIHWHGIILPENMDGVPGLSFEGIKPRRTYEYRFDVNQNGTYWYHSHSGLQEQLGHLGAMVIDPKDGDIGADREHTLILSDWTFEDPYDVFRNLKMMEGYYNHQKRTIFDTLREVRKNGFEKTWNERSMWGQMRMDSRDIADVSASTYTYLMNGRDSAMNWSALFEPGERVRLRIINGSAMTYFDVRIPGLEMIVVAADGQPVKPVTVDEFRIAVAETFDVIVQPKQAKPYTIFAESFDRSGYVRGTLTPEIGLEAPIPERRTMPELTMAAMGMDHGSMDHSTMNHDEMKPSEPMDHSMMGHGNMDHSKMGHSSQPSKPPVDDIPIDHKGHEKGPSAAMLPENPKSRLDEPGTGLEDAPHRVLVYSDLIGAQAWPDLRMPGRELELHLTGNMERYMWSFDGKKFSEVDGPIYFEYGERLRLILVNDTMMDHPIHLHGMWMELENGQSPNPRKHTISLKPNEKVSLLVTADAIGSWAFHCHLLYHMEAGMFRVVEVTKGAL